jgi:hypothetical protein
MLNIVTSLQIEIQKKCSKNHDYLLRRNEGIIDQIIYIIINKSNNQELGYLSCRSIPCKKKKWVYY